MQGLYQIDSLLEANITPMITLFHWDVPAGIDKRYGGFLPGTQEEELYLDYEHYARICFAAFGDRVKHWITHNEVRETGRLH
jgi:beta-glucosidase